MTTAYQTNIKDKTDILSWDKIPASACDLNFRRLSAGQAGDLGRGIRLVVLVSGGSVILSTLLSSLIADYVVSSTAATTSIIVGLMSAVFIASGVFHLVPRDLELPTRLRLAVASLFVVPGLWLLTVIASSTTSPSIALATLLVVVLPLSLYLADSIASHYILWMTANPRIDHATMVSWRDDWSRRFSVLPDRPPRSPDLSPEQRSHYLKAMRLRRSYLWGFAWVVACFCFSCITTLFAATLDIVGAVGTCISVQLLATMGVAACIRSVEAPGSCRLFLRAFASWLYYGHNRRDPPWTFQSPVGHQLYRQLLLVSTVALIALSLATMIVCDFADATLSDTYALSEFRLISVAVAFCLVVPGVLSPVILLLSCYVVAAPVLAAHYLALESPGAYEQHPDWTELDGYSERLRHSRNAIERRSIISGFHPVHEYPILLDTDLLLEHKHMMGATGVGKTALGLHTDTIQLIRRNDGPVIVVDCKGEMAFFNTVRLESERAGRTFKWFTNKPHRSTYVFNPMCQPHLKKLTIPEILGVIIQSLNLHHGDDYGRAWFAVAVRVLLRAAYLLSMPDHWSHRDQRKKGQATLFEEFPPIESFRDLEQAIGYAAKNAEEYQAARHLVFLVQALADFEQLSLSPGTNPDHPAVRHAIWIPNVISEKQVIYFYLEGALDTASVSQIARLAMYSTLSAAMAYRDENGKPARIYFICDEAQALIAKNLEMVLAQARAFGMACILSHQTMSQLNPPGGVDLRDLVLNCTSVKQYFSARDPGFQKFLGDVSGTVLYHSLSWDQLKGRAVGGETGRRYACTGSDGVMRVTVKERAGPRLEPEDIRDVNRESNQSIFLVERNSGYSQFHGAFPMHTAWPISKEEHDRRNFEIPWPETTSQTLEIKGDWPEATEHTLTPTKQPTATPDLSIEQAHEDLRQIRREMEAEGDFKKEARQ